MNNADRKFIKGAPITSLDELLKQECVVIVEEGKDRLVDKSYLTETTSAFYLLNLIALNALFYAEEFKGISCVECLYCSVQDGRIWCDVRREKVNKKQTCALARKNGLYDGGNDNGRENEQEPHHRRRRANRTA